MRRFLLALAFLAVPTMVAAQQQGIADREADPAVELQQSMDPAPTLDAERAGPDEVAPQLPAVESSRADEPAAVQEGGPTTRGWWWLVGAIVAGGIILAVLL